MSSHNLEEKIVKLLIKCWRSSIGTFVCLNQKENERERKEWKQREEQRRKSRAEHEDKMKSANMLLLKQKENKAGTLANGGLLNSSLLVEEFKYSIRPIHLVMSGESNFLKIVI